MRTSNLKGALVALLGTGCTALAASRASAQDVPVVFVHGVNSDSTYWLPIAGQLSAILRMSPVTKSTIFYKAEAEQATLLTSKLSDDSRTSSSALRLGFVAHSNGGLVSRQLSKTDVRLEKLATVGVPHRGAKVADNWLSYSVYNYANHVVSSMFAPLNYYVNNDPGVPSIVQFVLGPAFNTLGGIFNGLHTFLCPIAGFCVGLKVANQVVPVVYDLATTSQFIGALNASSNLVREASAISKRIGLYSSIEPVNGLFHLFFPSSVNTLAATRALMVASYLSLWSHYEFDADYDLSSHRQLWLNGAVALIDIDANWYNLIGTLVSHTISINPAGQYTTQTVIYASDGLIDHRSAGYPNGTLIQQIPGNIAHSEQSSSPAVKNALEVVLQQEFGLTQRSAPPPPPPYWQVIIHGPGDIRPGDACYWYASSGIANASYEWLVNGNSLGSAQDFWYTASGSFTLTVNVWNAQSHSGTSSATVNVSGANGQCYVQ